MVPGVRVGPQYEKSYLHTCRFILKKIFSRTSGPISTKLGINYPWVKGILNCSNERPGPLQRGDNNNAKMGEVI
jgi:hypothetical protein